NAEPAAMQGALNLTAMQDSIGQQGFGVSTDVPGRIELVAHAVERHLDSSDLYAYRFVVSQFGERSRHVPFLVHRHRCSSYAVRVKYGRGTIACQSATGKVSFCFEFANLPLCLSERLLFKIPRKNFDFVWWQTQQEGFLRARL